MKGIIEDAAGNTSDLSKMNIKSTIKGTEEDSLESTDKKEISNTSKTPTTGDKIAMSAAILLTVILTAVIVELLYRRNKNNK